MARLIDADELLRRYDETHEGPPGKARKLIEEAPTVGGWISVEDMMPDNANHPGGFCPRYLVYTDYGITEGWYNPDEGCWFGYLSYMTRVYEEWNIDLERGDIPKTVKNIPVKYWMSFPEAPKEEKDAG